MEAREFLLPTRHYTEEAHLFSDVLLLLLELCVIIGAVVFVAGAFQGSGEGTGKFYGLNTYPKRSAGVEISAATLKGLELDGSLSRNNLCPCNGND